MRRLTSMNGLSLWLLLLLLGWCNPCLSDAADATPPHSPSSDAQTTLNSGVPDFDQILRLHDATLAAVVSDSDALKVFTEGLGRTLGLPDAALTLRAKSVPSSLAKDLFIAELRDSANRLVAGLAAWRLARLSWEAIEKSDAPRVAGLEAELAMQREWLERQGLSPLLLGHDAKQLEASAITRTFTEWSRLHHWKDRVRDHRGLARLCGAWQWTIHNHQNHHEQKLVIAFPSADSGSHVPGGPAEIVVLGENVYLRWETEGRIQEDSLQFAKEGQRLEGTFVNNLGGWGSISAKRSGACPP